MWLLYSVIVLWVGSHSLFALDISAGVQYSGGSQRYEIGHNHTLSRLTFSDSGIAPVVRVSHLAGKFIGELQLSYGVRLGQEETLIDEDFLDEHNPTVIHYYSESVLKKDQRSFQYQLFKPLLGRFFWGIGYRYLATDYVSLSTRQWQGARQGIDQSTLFNETLITYDTRIHQPYVLISFGTTGNVLSMRWSQWYSPLTFVKDVDHHLSRKKYMVSKHNGYSVGGDITMKCYMNKAYFYISGRYHYIVSQGEQRQNVYVTSLDNVTDVIVIPHTFSAWQYGVQLGVGRDF